MVSSVNMSFVLLLPMRSRFSYCLPNKPFRCVYKNSPCNRYNFSDVIVDREEWKIIIDLKPKRDSAEIRIFRPDAPQHTKTDFNTEVFVKICSPSGEGLTFSKTGNSNKSFYFPLTEKALKNISVTLTCFDFIVQIKTTPILKDPIYGCSTEKRPSSDLVMIVEEKRLFISVEWLAKHSKYFQQIQKRMSELEMDEKSELPTLTLHGVNYDDFMELINIVAYPDEAITVKNVEAPIELADYLLFTEVFNKCEAFLLEDPFDYFSLSYKLLLSQAYYMPNLKEKCIEKLADLKPTQLRKDKFFQELDSQTTAEIVKRRMERIGNETRIKGMQWEGVPVNSWGGRNTTWTIHNCMV